MIAIVTGSSGFIGGHLVDALLPRGATVRALVRPQSAKPSRIAGVTYCEVDVLDAHAVRASDVWNDATHVFHLAGLTTAPSLDAFRRGNVLPLTHMLDALSARSSRPRVVFVSSQAAAGPARNSHSPVRESDSPHPIEDYGRSKFEAEAVVARKAAALLICVVRPPAVYGPRDRDFLAAFKQVHRRFALFASPPDHQLHVVHVHDVVNALLLAGEHSAAIGQTYFLSANTPLSWRELYRLVAQLAGTNPREIVVPALLLKLGALAGDLFGTVTGRTPLLNSQKLALGAARYWLADSARIRHELDWKPAHTAQDGIRQTYLWYVAAGWLPAQKSFHETT